MFRFAVRRLLQTIPVLFVIITATFFMVRFVPGGPFTGEKAIPPEIAFERDSVNAIVVNENDRITHRLVSDAAKEHRGQPADRDGIVHTPRDALMFGFPCTAIR